jgi:A/G-specific adenine glycosylase
MSPSEFQHRLYAWAAEHPRPLPWKGISDPYRIWLSEILLQQTRVEQGKPYYQRFVEAYPTVEALAAAPESSVMKLWEGLGYYSRARNLHKAAKYVADTLDGVFPNTYEGLLNLPGVGPYTAAAIASFAYNLPQAVLDGNVYRVLSRIWGYEQAIDTPEARNWMMEKASTLIDQMNPGKYNQAIMDFGATWCTPKQAKCSQCPMSDHCTAHQQGLVAELPRKSKRIKKRNRFFLYAVIRYDGKLYFRERTEKDIWQKLWEFPMLEVAQMPAGNKHIGPLLIDSLFAGSDSEMVKTDRVHGPYKHTLTHQEIFGFFAVLSVNIPNWRPNATQNWKGVDQLTLKNMLAKPRLVDRFLEDNSLSLSLF